MTGRAHWLRTAAPAAALAAIPALLSLRFGGFHVRHLGWVALVLGVWACVEVARGKLSALRSIGGVACIAFAALAGWTLLSLTWVDASSHDAWVEAVRTTTYLATFLLGGALLANARAYVRFVWMAAAGTCIVGLATVVRMLGDTPLVSFVAGRLDWPIGYAPGTAALYLVATFLLLGTAVAAERRWTRSHGMGDLAASSVALSGAGLCAALAALSQSRGTLPAVGVAVAVALVATPMRTAWLLRGVAVAGMLVASRSSLAAVYQDLFALRQAPFTKGSDEKALLAAAEQSAREAATTILVGMVALLLLGAIVCVLSAWLTTHLRDWEQRTGTRLVIPVTVLCVVFCAVLLVMSAQREPSPVSWARDQVDACVHPPEVTNDPGSATSHFSNTGTGRCDYYRVALLLAREQPLTGVGAGNFRSGYVRERRTAEEPLFVHSLPLQMLAELGVVGAALAATVLGCVVLAGWRFVRSGTARDPAFAGALAALGYWTTHASIDWLWQLPAVTLVPMALAGGLVACVSAPQRPVRRAVAAPIAAGAALACVALVLPVTMADAKLRRARDPELRERDPKAALEAAQSARRFDPGWAEPWITEGVLRLAAGDRKGAADAGRRAVNEEPRSWSVQFRASGLIALDDTNEGRRAFLEARELNPRLPAVIDDEDDQPAVDPDSLQHPDA